MVVVVVVVVIVVVVVVVVVVLSFSIGSYGFVSNIISRLTVMVL